MPYSKGSKPFEAASKIAHMELIRDPALQNLVQNLKLDGAPRAPTGTTPSHHVDLSIATSIREVVTVDAGLQVVPNPVRRDKAMSFINPGVSILSLADLDRIAADPMMDPRQLGAILGRCTLRPAYLPLRGVRLTGRSMRETLRQILNSSLLPAVTGLYDVLEFLLFEKWLSASAPRAPRSMNCLSCGRMFDLPPQQLFSCTFCGYDHYLSDYLGLLSDKDAEDRPSETIANAFMGLLEILTLFRLPMLLTQRGREAELERILLIKDGSLMLRAEGFRVIDGVRRYLAWLRGKGVRVNLVGVEKTGDMANFLEDFPQATPHPGDVFIPDRKLLKEEIQGKSYDAAGYRDRVTFGSRMGARLSETHVVALQMPAVDLDNGGPERPTKRDFPELDEVVRALSRLTSARYDNAITPLVQINRQVSLAQSTSARLLEEFVVGLMKSA